VVQQYLKEEGVPRYGKESSSAYGGATPESGMITVTVSNASREKPNQPWRMLDWRRGRNGRTLGPGKNGGKAPGTASSQQSTCEPENSEASDRQKGLPTSESPTST